MAQETHVWFDGDHWQAYTERRGDLARFTEWFGGPQRLGRDGACAHWVDLPPDALRIRRRATRAKRKPMTDEAKAALRERLTAGRKAGAP